MKKKKRPSIQDLKDKIEKMRIRQVKRNALYGITKKIFKKEEK